MKRYWTTVLAYSKNVATTGALFETSKMVVKEMTHLVTPHQAQVIIELGAGHGNITEVILQKMHPDSILLAFELHSEFCDELKARISDRRLHVVNDSADKIKSYLAKHQQQHADLVISALPLVVIPNEVVDSILQQAKDVLQNKGHFLQVSYSLIIQKKLKSFFGKVNKKMVLLNAPPAVVYTCQTQ